MLSDRAVPERTGEDSRKAARYRVAFRTFGCKLNLYESSGMRQLLAGAGHTGVENEAQADLVVVNTCSVTMRADQEARQYIRRLHRRRPETRVVVTGCYAQRAPDELAGLPGVALVAGHAEKDRIVDLLDTLPGADEAPRVEVGPLAGKTMTSLRAIGVDGRTRALLRVQDGCDSACTYCIIPQTRGGSTSLPAEDVVGEARRTLEAGYREIVITGTHLGHWGLDLNPRRRLSEVVEAILAIDHPVPFRVRLSSIEPQEIDARMIDLLADSERLAPHLHLPLQSGSDSMLRAMRRAYRTPNYRRQVERVAARVPDLALGADLIVGFPGETEGDFRSTLAFLADLPFTYLHPFTYSPRPGTPAAGWKHRPPGDIASRRLAAARALVGRRNRSYRERLVGTIATVLVETTDGSGNCRGLTERYVPVTFAANRDLAGRFALVNLTGLSDDGFVGTAREALP